MSVAGTVRRVPQLTLGRERAAEITRRALTITLVGLASVAVAVYVVVALRRLGSPSELEWMEGGMLDHARRALAGHSLYGPPRLAFTPYIYPPLYAYVSAAVIAVTGPSLAALRAVSLVSSVAAGAAVFGLVHSEVDDRVAGAVAVGFLAACYRLSGAWFDVARTDSLFLALLLCGLWLVWRAHSTRAVIGAAALLALACLAKQSALLPTLAVIPLLISRGRRMVAWFVGTLAATLAIAVLLLQWSSRGWFLFYIVDLPGRHAIAHEFVVGFWTHDLFFALWPILLVAAIGAFAVGANAYGRDARLFLLPVVAGLVLTSYVARIHTGGYNNVLLPAYAAVAILTGIGIAHVRRASGWRMIAIVAIVGCIAEFAMLAYNPSAQVPSGADRAAAERLVSRLRGIHGPVYLPAHGWYLAAAGHPTTAQGAAIEDVLRAHAGSASRDLAGALEHAVRSRSFAAVVVDRPSLFSYLPADFGRFYEERVDLVKDRASPSLVTGSMTRPAAIWFPRDVPLSGITGARRAL